MLTLSLPVAPTVTRMTECPVPFVISQPGRHLMLDPASATTAAIHGASLGAGLIIAIGAQNAFVLRQGLTRDRPLLVAAICSLCDAALIVAGVAGLGRMVAGNPAFIAPLAWFGVVFLAAYGIRAVSRAAGSSHAALRAAGHGSDRTPTRALILTTLAISLLNPHVYLDTVVLLGSVGAQFPGVARVAYAAGAIAASIAWFFGLAFGARFLAPWFARPGAWRVLDLLIAAIMFTIAARLAQQQLAP